MLKIRVYLGFHLALPFVVFLQIPAAGNEEPKFKRVETEDAFVETFVGKRLIYESGAVVVFLEDRTFSGSFSGSPIWGEWVWRDDRLCHQINIGEKRYKVACKLPEVAKNKARFIREDGSHYGVARIR